MSTSKIPVTDTIKHVCVTSNKKFKFDTHTEIVEICRKGGGEINALNRLNNSYPPRRSVIGHLYTLPYGSQPDIAVENETHRNYKKVNERDLCYIYKDTTSSYTQRWTKINLTTLENRRIEDMVISVRSCL